MEHKSKKNTWPANSEHVGAGKIGAGGTPLPETIRKTMEDSLGADFSDVRVLNNSCIPQSVGARAFTQGTDVHFSSGSYNPHSSGGRILLAHELTHVVQQRNAREGKP